jgi:hypothetical protein
MTNCKIVEKGDTDSSLVVHYMRPETGRPACGIRPRPWRGKEMVVIEFVGRVTCGRKGCA